VLVLSRKVDQTIVIQDNITIKILEINGDRVKLGINAPRDVVILREELREEVHQENLRAAHREQDAAAALRALGETLARRRATT
jgi:carbon storage regulator